MEQIINTIKEEEDYQHYIISCKYLMIFVLIVINYNERLTLEDL